MNVEKIQYGSYIQDSKGKEKINTRKRSNSESRIEEMIRQEKQLALDILLDRRRSSGK